MARAVMILLSDLWGYPPRIHPGNGPRASRAGILSREEAREELKSRGDEPGAYTKVEADNRKPAEVLPPSAEML